MSSIDRRHFLRYSGLLAGGAFMPGALLGAPIVGNRTGLHLQKTMSAAARGSTPPPPSYVPKPPYTLTSDCSLSEDHYLVRVGMINPQKDHVVAYRRSDGLVEALLLSDGRVSQIYRDASQPGGWNSRAVPNAVSVTDMAGGTAIVGGQETLHVFFKTAGDNGKLHHVVGHPDGSLQATDALDWAASGPLRVTDDTQGGADTSINLLVYAATPSSSGTGGFNNDAKLSYYYFTNAAIKESSGTVTGFPLSAQTAVAATVSAVVSLKAFGPSKGPALTLVAAGSSNSDSVSTYVCQLAAGTKNSGSVVAFSSHPRSSAVPATGGTRRRVLGVDYAYVSGSTDFPWTVARVDATDQTGRHTVELWTLALNIFGTGGVNDWYWSQVSLPANTPSTFSWQPSRRTIAAHPGYRSPGDYDLLDVFLVDPSTSKLSVVRQVALSDDSGVQHFQAIFNPPTPFQGGVGLMSVAPQASSDDQVILSEGDGTLHQLSRNSLTGGEPADPDDPLTGTWVDQTINLPHDEPQEVDTYRIQMTLVDSWAVAASGATMQLSSAIPVTALVNGRALQLSSTPTTVTLDGAGQIVVSLIADGLFAPAISVSRSGLTPVTISPSEPVNAYMAGGTTLNALPQLDSKVLAGATDESGRLVFPAAHSDAGTAQLAVTTLAAAAKAAAGTAQGGPMKVTLGPTDLGRARPVVVEGIELSFSHLASDVLHAIKTGATKVISAAVSVATNGLDRVVSLVTDIADWSNHELQLTINGLEDAAHLFHSVVNKVGASLQAAVDWLKAKILQLLKDTVTVAEQYYDWLKEAPAYFTTALRAAKGGAHGWAQRQESAVHAAFATAKVKLAGRTLGGSSNSVSSARGSTPHALGAGPPSPTSGAHAGWLLDKMTQLGTGGPSIDLGVDLTQQVNELWATLAHAGGGLVTSAEMFEKNLLAGLNNPSQLASKTLAAILDLLESLVATFLNFLDSVLEDVVDVLLQLIGAVDASLKAPMPRLPLVGSLLTSAGMSSSPTLGEYACLLAAFPLVLSWKIKHGAGAVPPLKHTNVSTTSSSNVDVADSLNQGTAVATAVWAAIDTGLVSANLVNSEYEPPAVLAMCDVVMPLVIMALTVPTGSGDEPYGTPPVVRGDSASIATFVAWASGIVGTVTAALTLCLAHNARGGGKTLESLAADVGIVLTAITGGITLVTGLVATGYREDAEAEDWMMTFFNSAGPISVIGQASAARASSDDLTAGVSAFVIAVAGIIETTLLSINPPNPNRSGLLPLGGSLS